MDSAVVVTCKAHFKTSQLFSDLFDSAWIWTDENIQHISLKWNSTFVSLDFGRKNEQKVKKHILLLPPNPAPLMQDWKVHCSR